MRLILVSTVLLFGAVAAFGAPRPAALPPAGPPAQ